MSYDLGLYINYKEYDGANKYIADFYKKMGLIF